MFRISRRIFATVLNPRLAFSIALLDDLFIRLGSVSKRLSLLSFAETQQWLKLLLSTRGAFSERMEVLEENRRTLSSSREDGVVEEPAGTTEAKAGPRGDERGGKHLLLSENGVKIPLRRNVNVSE